MGMEFDPRECKDEVWRVVPDWAAYRVSNLGNMASRYKRRKNYQGDPWELSDTWQSMKPILAKGYLMVGMTNPTMKRMKWIHQIVMLTFIGPCPVGQETRHLDGNPLNNRLDNLAYGTPKENQNDRKRHGTAFVGSKNPSAKLTEKDVRTIRDLHSYGASSVGLANQFGVSVGNISQIVHRRTWLHVE